MKAAERPHVLVLTHFFPPEPCAAANRVFAMAQALDGAGFEVHIVTGVASFPTGSIRPDDRVVFPETKLLGRIALTRVWTYASTKLSGRNRILNWLSVAVSSSAYVLQPGRRYDLVIVSIPPISLALPAFVALMRHRAQLVVDVRDVFPDVAVKMGYWREGTPVVRFVGALSAALYRAARLTIAVTESARYEIVARGSDEANTIVAANGFDRVVAAAASPYARRPNDFVAAFVGNMGLATGLDVIIDAAIALRDEPRVRFVLAGGGADYARLAARLVSEDLSNVILLGVVPRDCANALIAGADVSVVPLHRSIVDSLPTKLFDALALGCPVLCCADGEAARFVERSGGGIVVAPEDGAALAAAIRVCIEAPELRELFAARGRAYVTKHYDRAEIMRSVAGRLYNLQLKTS
jgi:glycosyltransferase involved in cell wall biosynthesis